MTEPYKSSLGYPDEHMRLLGLIAAHWESFEMVLERTLATVMMHEPSRVAFLTMHMSFANKIDLLTIYAREAFVISQQQPLLWTEYNKIVKRLQGAYSLRNRYVHAKWRLDRKTGEFMRHDVRTKGGKLDVVFEPTTVAPMEDAVREITAAGEEFVMFFLKRGIGPAPEPEQSS